ncbi:NUDIX hydrolase [Streptacidiphilus anmyonensis]|uniref:NUDIX hydrolase n=1 Tax=Streptacidiphilus anmyonensis TaxID=405782 RepID=UPI0005AABDA4|nr:NUDIX domain-containing protein [Streptacidiphilus anmyonensis]
MSNPLHSVSVAGVVVRDDGRVLAVQRADNGAWEPPGGVLELSETVEEGAKREVYEETGVRVTVDRLTGIYKNVPRGIVALVFLCRPEHGQARPSDETTAVDWLTPAEVSVRMSEVFAVRVLDALGGGERAAIRAHDGRVILD